MLTHTGAGNQVERPGPEPVGGAGQCAHWADLHGVAGEVRLERLVGVDADLLQGATLEHLDERVAGDLVGEPGAPRAQDAALAVEEYLGGDVDRLGERAFDVVEPGIGAAVGHCLVLQRALTALVAHRAVERVVDQQQLHHPVLSLVGRFGAELGAHHHVVGHRDGARRHRFALALDLDQALAAGADRIQQRVVAEPGDLNADQLSGADHQSAFGNADFGAVYGQRHQFRLSNLLPGVSGLSHAWSPFAASMDSRGSNGHPPPSTCATYSSRKYWIDDATGLAAPSPNAQNDFPRIASEMSSSLSISSWVPLPFSSRS